ncbi:hypothetical protein IC3_00905 [Bacillus cereus VD142]|nr:hypothetical protein IC3_00905 [Bacillus cereus VD142]
MLKNRNVGFYYGMEKTVMLDNPPSKKVNEYEKYSFTFYFILYVKYSS